ncbi:hypothetical protein ES707_18767 [subsurface metagenome]
MDTVEWTEPEAGIAALGQLPVAGATAEITLAYLPSCARHGVTLNFHLDFRSTSAETISVRPHMYLGDIDHAFSARELEPGQSFSEKYGRRWLAGVYGLGAVYFERVEAAIEVYTPEGWIEVDRVAGEPFSWQSTHPLPQLIVTSAPESAPPGTEVAVNFEIYNPGFCTPPAGFHTVDDERFPALIPGLRGAYDLPPDQSTPFTYTFIMGDQDKTITLIPYRFEPVTNQPLAGEPVSVTVKMGVARAGCATLIAAGILLVAGTIACLILLV